MNHDRSTEPVLLDKKEPEYNVRDFDLESLIGDWHKMLYEL